MITCPRCRHRFHIEKAKKICSNCFACLGCQIYICPKCGGEVTVKRPEKPSWDDLG